MSNPQPLTAIATSVGVSARTLRQHALRDGFPRPILECGRCGTALLYDADDVAQWEATSPKARTRRRRGPRRPQIAWPLESIAEDNEITVETLRRHTHQDGFPKPLSSCGKCHGSSVYEREDVLRFEAGAQPDPSDRLVTLQEAAEELGLSYGSMRTYLGRHEDFPKPFKYDGPRPLFSLQQITSWQENRHRKRSTQAEAAAQDVLDVDGLLTRAGVAKELGIKLDSVTRYMRRDTEFSRDFPQSVRKIGRSRLWDPQEIRDWRAGRPNTPRAQR